ncbi:c-type cytochrome [Rhizobium sp. NRK18]|uniref:c-type cytochrome n=1 Tax=Rhizobium sp. NRK18 TaxID=2964667 RepID=UPI0021C4133C|nr:cytochrome c [Rhizobium sp. NRK18]MCQ2002727.1 cytochrome c [Rhizobium sp. NRK18]
MLRRTLAASLAAAGILAPAAASAFTAEQIAKGEAHYQQDCARCHASPQMLLESTPGATTFKKGVWMTPFLARHHAPVQSTRALIIGYIESFGD